jgi:hypothetical protein
VNGQATFCYTGPAQPGADAITAYADTNSNSTSDVGEPSNAAAKTWVVSYAASIQPPINADGSSVFSAKRGVVPVKFKLIVNGAPTCALPPATISLTRIAGGTLGVINESVYTQPSDTGSNFRVDSCQYVYNLGVSSLGVGTYLVEVRIQNATVGNATFSLN